MALPQAWVDYQLCKPERCADGICPAVKICKRKILLQDAPYEAPYRLSEMCTGCGECVPICPLGAIYLR
ncbi:MAG: 4Fe-4S binding protein [Deltaproteobacteria bacterium]|nr:4Fe-4S binding protein [Deltaproteobacteria bacterium]